MSQTISLVPGQGPAPSDAAAPARSGGRPAVAADVMVTTVITVSPHDTVQTAAKLLLDHRISGLPVVDADGTLVGILSEGDLVRRAEIGTEKRRSWWLELLTSPETRASEYVKSHATTVADVMTYRIVTAEEDAPLGEIATLMERHGVKRIPILRDGRLVGLVSRSNLLQAFARTATQVAPGPADDRVLRERVLDSLQGVPGGMPWLLTVTVSDGVVELRGPVGSTDERHALRVAAEATPGVKRVATDFFRMPRSAE